MYRFYRDALASQADFSLNVFGGAHEETGGMRWAWQLARMHDGMTDEDAGTFKEGGTVESELYAATAGLGNLRQRVSAAGRSTGSYAVEIRCSEEAERRLNADALPASMKDRWLEERAAWKLIEVIGLRAAEPE